MADSPVQTTGTGLVSIMAKQYMMEPKQFYATIQRTILPNPDASVEQVSAFLVVANQYGLNPFTREIFAFPAKSGGIQPVVSIDGWVKIMNSHPAFNGMAFHDEINADGELVSITCKIYRKDRANSTDAVEYMDECKRDTQPWKQWPRRMLRHKATIQAARYAFGFAGIIDPDEAERFAEAGILDVTPPPTVLPPTEPTPKSAAAKARKKMDAAKPAEEPVAESSQSVPTKPGVDLFSESEPAEPLDKVLRYRKIEPDKDPEFINITFREPGTVRFKLSDVTVNKAQGNVVVKTEHIREWEIVE